MARLKVAAVSGALVLSALVGGTLISSVAAAPYPTAAAKVAVPAEPSAPPAPAPSTGPAAKYCSTFRTDLARNLGVDAAALTTAARSAALSTVDAAVAAGDLTPAVGDRLKARINAAPADGCAAFVGWARRAAGPLGVARDGLSAAAVALDMTPAELRTQLVAGTTLRQVATARNVAYETVTAAVMSAVKEDLDAAVAAGRIPQAREDRMLDRLEHALAEGRLRPAPAATPTTQP